MSTPNVENYGTGAVKNLKLAPIRHASERLRHGSLSRDAYIKDGRDILTKHGAASFKVLDPKHYDSVLFDLRFTLAKRLAERVAIFPLKPERKDPCSFTHAHHSATRDLDIICDWIKQEGNCNWGGGKAIDIDVRNDGMANWARLIAEHGEPDTAQQITPTGGLHYLIDEDVGKCDLASGVEIPNYVVLAGSFVRENDKDIRATGFYQWATPSR
jgi:hypothetical protein